MLKKIFLIVLLLIGISLAVWYFTQPTDTEVLMLESDTLTIYLDKIPDKEEDAISLAKQEIINYTNIPKKKFNKYFELINTSNTQFQWKLVYSVKDNPNLSVFMIKKLSAEEGFDISKDYIINKLGRDYFKNYFVQKKFDLYPNSASGTAYYTYKAEDIELTQWIKIGENREVKQQYLLNEPQKININKEQAIKISKDNGLIEPLTASPVLKNGKIYWVVTRQYTPTEQDYVNKTFFKFDIDATTGKIVKKYVYEKPSATLALTATPTPIKTPIQASQIKSFVDALKFRELKDGAMVQMHIMNSFEEDFSVVKSYGKTVVKEGKLENPDITIKIDRNLLTSALESNDIIDYLQKKANSNNLIVETHKDQLTLYNKGYLKIYNTLKG
ncbi:MAG: hypothetical protein ACE5J9_06460 [Methanosarcinales archaeon]